jgi:hypothetical protein
MPHDLGNRREGPQGDVRERLCGGPVRRGAAWMSHDDPPDHSGMLMQKKS